MVWEAGQEEAVNPAESESGVSNVICDGIRRSQARSIDRRSRVMVTACVYVAVWLPLAYKMAADHHT
jgi:hypothetical protein